MNEPAAKVRKCVERFHPSMQNALLQKNQKLLFGVIKGMTEVMMNHRMLRKANVVRG